MMGWSAFTSVAELGSCENAVQSLVFYIRQGLMFDVIGTHKQGLALQRKETYLAVGDCNVISEEPEDRVEALEVDQRSGPMVDGLQCLKP